MACELAKWSKDYELSHYWDVIDRQDYLNQMAIKMNRLRVDRFAPAVNPQVCVDVGGGKYGGALHFYTKGRHRVVVDALADTFEPIDGISFLPGYSNSLPIAANSVDVLFCIECLDHCDDFLDLFESLAQLTHVLAPGGILFFQMPLRAAPIEGHPVSSLIVEPGQIIDFLNGPGFELLYRDQISGTSPRDLYLVIKKRRIAG